MRRRHRRRSSPLALAVALAASPAVAQGGEEETERSPDIPFEVEDAFATPRGEGEISGGFLYRRGRGSGGRDTYEVAPQIQLGLPYRLEFRAAVEESFGNSEQARQGGFVRLGLFHQFNEERPGQPVFGVLGAVTLPYGPVERGTETTLLGAVSRFSSGKLPFGLHANAVWYARIDPTPEERPHRYRIIVSASQAVRTNTVLVASFLRESQERGEQDRNLIRLGFRHRLPDNRTSFGLLAGFGIGRDSPRFEIGLGVLHRF
jgi:hypothetical protein